MTLEEIKALGKEFKEYKEDKFSSLFTEIIEFKKGDLDFNSEDIISIIDNPDINSITIVYLSSDYDGSKLNIPYDFFIDKAKYFKEKEERKKQDLIQALKWSINYSKKSLEEDSKRLKELENE